MQCWILQRTTGENGGRSSAACAFWTPRRSSVNIVGRLDEHWRGKHLPDAPDLPKQLLAKVRRPLAHESLACTSVPCWTPHSDVQKHGNSLAAILENFGCIFLLAWSSSSEHPRFLHPLQKCTICKTECTQSPQQVLTSCIAQQVTTKSWSCQL